MATWLEVDVDDGEIVRVGEIVCEFDCELDGVALWLVVADTEGDTACE